MKFTFHGEIPPYLTAKDLILAVIGEIGVDGATYRTMYFAGDGVSSLTLEDRMTLTNMAIEAGGKNGVCDVDEKTLQYVRNRSNVPSWEVFRDDPDAATSLRPNGICRRWSRWSPSRTAPTTRTPLTTAVTSSSTAPTSAPAPAARSPTCSLPPTCSPGNSVKIDTFVVPGSTEVHADMKRLNLRGVEKGPNEKSIEDVLLDAGCKVGPSGCSACLGGPVDTFGRLNGAEVCISTTNRNFPGRMGSTKSAVYLASPLTVAASALDRSRDRPAGIRQPADRDGNGGSDVRTGTGSCAPERGLVFCPSRCAVIDSTERRATFHRREVAGGLLDKNSLDGRKTLWHKVS